MHIPDGFLDPPVAFTTYLISGIFAIYAFRKAKLRGDGDKTTLAAVLAAVIFSAQMINWPIPGGTSLHFVGGAMAGALLGPWLGFVTMFLVLLVQTLVFHDGGITAFGANLLNMAVLDVLVGYSLYKVFPDDYKWIGAFLGGWIGIIIAGIACGIEIGLSSQFPYAPAVTVYVMGVWHSILGLIEGIVTSASLFYISRRAPHLVTGARSNW